MRLEEDAAEDTEKDAGTSPKSAAAEIRISKCHAGLRSQWGAGAGRRGAQYCHLPFDMPLPPVPLLDLPPPLSVLGLISFCAG